MPNTGLMSGLNPTLRSLIIFRIKHKCCQYIKYVYWYFPISAPLSMKPIQSPFDSLEPSIIPIKPREDLDHHQVGT